MNYFAKCQKCQNFLVLTQKSLECYICRNEITYAYEVDGPREHLAYWWEKEQFYWEDIEKLLGQFERIMELNDELSHQLAKYILLCHKQKQTIERFKAFVTIKT
jgi:hypothetical protein